MMRKIAGLALGLVVGLAAGIASAQNVQGTVVDIDPTAKTITVEQGQGTEVYRMPEATTAGVSLEELKVGDRVDVLFNPEDEQDSEAVHNAMMVEKIEE